MAIKSKDKILLKEIELFAYHGVLPEEKVLGQIFILSVDMNVDLRRAGRNDDIDETVNYAELAKDVAKFFCERSFNLIEAAAEAVAAHILVRWPEIISVEITIDKPSAAIGLSLKAPSVSIVRGWHRAFVALGANLGDMEQTLRAALADMGEIGSYKSGDQNKPCLCDTTIVKRVSAFYKTKPEGVRDQPDFLNAVCELKTLAAPTELLQHLRSIEDKHGRLRNIKWGPRTLDLDILLYDDLVTDEPSLVIPHPRMQERRFVLEPLCELEPWLVHPLSGKRMADALAELERS